MPLEMKATCQNCQTPLSQDGIAFICSHECTYCAPCADSLGQCPNCRGELLPRPRRVGEGSPPLMTLERLDAFNQAWQQADVKSLAHFITDDCVYSASVGPEPGKTYVGRQEVEQGFREILAYEDGGEGTSGPLFIYGDRGFSHWSVIKTLASGEKVEIRGCDFFEFEGDRIRRKDAFVKTLPLR